MDRSKQLALLKNHIRNIPDFPEPGIQFKDITPLLKNAKTLKITAQLLAQPFLSEDVDYVVGLESRGFLFGPGLAQSLEAGFVPVRKPGKLPAETITASYSLEYGKNSVDIHTDAIPPGSRVLIHDDLIATGGTAKAATELVQKLDAEVMGYSFIIELEFLKGRDLLQKSAPAEVLICF